MAWVASPFSAKEGAWPSCRFCGCTGVWPLLTIADWFKVPYCAPVFQVIFNPLSASEMAALPKDLQLDILSDFQVLPEDLENLDSQRFGKVRREGRSLHRCRTSDYRIYFERHEMGILVHRVLHKNTIRDFLFRSNLPLDEDEQLGQSGGFWKMIEEGESKA